MLDKGLITVQDIVNILPVKAETNNSAGGKLVRGVYCCDLLSWVISNASKGDIWVTIQNHINVVAVAKLVGIPLIIIVEDSEVNKEVISKAEEEKIDIVTTNKTAYEIAAYIAKLQVFK